jgi:hypothetical protein
MGPTAWLPAVAASLRPQGVGAFRARGGPALRAHPPADDADAGRAVTVERYRHADFALTYLHRPAAPGREADRPIVLLHPVGIGLSSWFWARLLDAWADDGPALYAPDLIGCGLAHGADPWDPAERGLFFPLSWVEGVETLLETVVVPRWRDQQQPLAGDARGRDGGGGCLVVAQGGLAPVGILLAHRNPRDVEHLMLTSPPSYADVTTAVPERELRKNYDFLRSPTLGAWAFAVLESRAVIEFFSNLFLFQGACDARWLDEAMAEACAAARTPVQAFNAGLLQHRSFARELAELTQAVVVVSGEGGRRAAGREPYRSALNACTLKTVPGGCNVLPWETPSAIVALIKELGY